MRLGPFAALMDGNLDYAARMPKALHGGDGHRAIEGHRMICTVYALYCNNVVSDIQGILTTQDKEFSRMHLIGITPIKTMCQQFDHKILTFSMDVCR